MQIGDPAVGVDHGQIRSLIQAALDRGPDRVPRLGRQVLDRLQQRGQPVVWVHARGSERLRMRSEEHTSELQSRQYLVCRLLLEKKKKKKIIKIKQDR